MKSKRLEPISPEKAEGEVKQFYDLIQQKMGKVPNIFQNMGHSPAVLKGYFALSEAVGQTSFSPKLREQIALTIAQANDCNYCLSAHSVIGKAMGLQDNEILQARQGLSSNKKDEAILAFVRQIVSKKGKVSDEDVAQVKLAGATEQELAEITLVVTLNLFTNYFNHITDTEIDFPLAPKLN